MRNLVIVNPAYSRRMRWEVQMARMGEFHTEFWWKTLNEDLKDRRREDDNIKMYLLKNRTG
jgi:hypothetical protein